MFKICWKVCANVCLYHRVHVRVVNSQDHAEVVDVEGGQERLLRRLVDSRAAQGEVQCHISAEKEFPNRDWNSLLRSALQEFSSCYVDLSHASWRIRQLYPRTFSAAHSHLSFSYFLVVVQDTAIASPSVISQHCIDNYLLFGSSAGAVDITFISNVLLPIWSDSISRRSVPQRLTWIA